jgi:Protein of unknown function (DUF3300)
LVHYPTAMQVLTKDPDWTQSLGSAFASDPTSVIKAIQDMRLQAQAVGNLKSDDHVNVIEADGVISIQPVAVAGALPQSRLDLPGDVPCEAGAFGSPSQDIVLADVVVVAQPYVMYVPAYDPVVVYTGPSAIVYDAGIPTGVWLVHGVDWYGGAVYEGDWHGGYYYRDGRWGRDYGYHYDRAHYWHHDDRWGAAPHWDRDRYARPYGVRGREEEFHHAMAAHERERRQVIARRDDYHRNFNQSHPGVNHPAGAPGFHPQNISKAPAKPAPKAAPQAPKKT